MLWSPDRWRPRLPTRRAASTICSCRTFRTSPLNAGQGRSQGSPYDQAPA